MLWERGLIDEREIKQYRLEAIDKQKIEDGSIKEGCKPNLLRELMANCNDFNYKKSAMEHLYEQLSAKE